MDNIEKIPKLLRKQACEHLAGFGLLAIGLLLQFTGALVPNTPT